MDKSSKSKRGIRILSVLLFLIIGGIVAGVIIWRERTKSHPEQKDQSLESNIHIGPSISKDRHTFSSVDATLTTLSKTSEAMTVSSTSSITEPSRPTTTASSSGAQATSSSNCQTIRKRKEWRDLSDQEQSEFLTAANEMFKKPSRKGNENLHMDFVQTHIKHKHEIHNTTIFFLWHRHFIFEYEKELKAINPDVSLPYWDWGMDYENPSSSPLFNENAFGGNGDNSTNCITNGAFSGIQTQFREQDVSPHCVQRIYGSTGNITTLPPPSLMMGYALFKDFAKFSSAFESYPHALAHNFIGGDMITNQSPSDPMFFLLHANVDRYFLIWQTENPTSSFPGSVQDKLPEYEMTISDAFHPSTDMKEYCYSYSSTSSQKNRKRDIVPKNSSKQNISYPSRVPAKFTKMMGGDPKMVQRLEDQSMEFINCLNDNGFESPAVGYSTDRNWKKYQIREGSYSRFQPHSKSRQQMEKCLIFLEESN